MSDLNRRFPLTLALFFLACTFLINDPSILATKAYADTLPKTADVHIGEDGIAYPVRQEEKSGWAYNKIEPVLEKEAQELDNLEVIIFLDSTMLQSITSQIKEQYLAQVETLAHEIKTIEDYYRPKTPLKEETEKQIAPELEAAISARDKARLNNLRKDIDDLIDIMRRQIAKALEQAVQPSQKQIAKIIETAGGKILSSTSTISTITAVVPNHLLETLARNPLVVSILKNRPTEYELDVSMPACGFDNWWDQDIDGGFFDFGIVDSGVQQDHPAFSGITFYTDSGSSVDSSNKGHGTHVAGIVASSDPTYTGGAFGIQSMIWSSSAGGQGNVIDHMEWQASTPAENPEVINHSLGYGVATDTDYSDTDAFYDAFVYHYNIQVSKSAGNEGWDDSNPSVTHPAPAYNILVVANMDDRNTMGRNDDVRRSSSSVGPTLANRKKPDITAPGTNIVSLNNSWSGAKCTNSDPNCWDSMSAREGCRFSTCSGTSMSAPHVAAAILLLEDGGNHNPMAQKAVLINTADAWDSQNTSSTSDDGPVNGSHWDKSYGWGYLDMAEARFNRNDYFLGSVVPRNNTAEPDDYKLYKGRMYANEKATLVWQKRANYVAGEPPSASFSLSDLNIRLYDENDNSLIDYDWDGNDNVHQVATGSTIDAVIKVYAWSTAFDGATSESFALATEENFLEAYPPSFQRAYMRPNFVGPNQTFDVTVLIYNNGDVTAHNILLTLENIPGISVNGANDHNLDPIEPGPYPNNPQETVYSLTTSGAAAGTHWLPLNVESQCYNETYTYHTSQGVGIIVETTPPESSSTSPAYANNTIEIDWTASDSQSGVKTTYLYVKRPGDSNFGYSGLSQSGTNGTFNYLPTGTDGRYYFAVRSVDNAGNWEAMPVAAESSTFFDSNTPVSHLSSPTYDTSGAIPLTFSVTDPAPSSGLAFIDFWYKRKGSVVWTYTGLFSNNSNGVVYFTPPTGEGTYHFVSRAKDNAENIENLPNGNGDTTIYDLSPPVGTIAINNGAAWTTSLVVTLHLTATDSASSVTSMRFSNNGSTWSAWEPYSNIRINWNLASFGGNPHPGNKTTYVQFMDAASWISSIYNTDIEYIEPCPGDMDRDLDIDGADLAAFIEAYSNNDIEADLNHDSAVDEGDIQEFSNNFGDNSCP